MKMTLGLILLATTANAVAQIRADQCPNPGQLLNTAFTRNSNERVSQSFRRSGTTDIVTEASFAGVLNSQTFLHYVDSFCVRQEYQTHERICRPMDPDIALGRGNDLLKSLFDLRISAGERALVFARNVKYSVGRPISERQEQVFEVLDRLAVHAATNGVPRSWPEFVGALELGATQGTVAPLIVEEITKLHGAHNRIQLGFVQPEGVIVREGRGNGALANALRYSSIGRGTNLTRLLEGVSPRFARPLGDAMVEFVQTRPMPLNWDQFVAMMNFALSREALLDTDLRRVVFDNEQINRARLGFELTAEQCRMEFVRRVHNAVNQVHRQEPGIVVSKRFGLEVKNAPLLQGEQENITVSWDGIGSVAVNASNDFNNYQNRLEKDGDVEKVTLTGTRKAVSPANTLDVQYQRSGRTNTLSFRNKNFNPNAGGKVIVTVKFMNGRIFKDIHLGTETFELTDGNVKTVIAANKHKEVDYVLVSMKIVGSRYYNNNETAVIKLHR